MLLRSLHYGAAKGAVPPVGMTFVAVGGDGERKITIGHTEEKRKKEVKSQKLKVKIGIAEAVMECVRGRHNG